MLAACLDDEIIQLGRRDLKDFEGTYDAVVASDVLPANVRADVVIMLPDTRGSSGTGTVTNRGTVRKVTIEGADRVIELLEHYVPHTTARGSSDDGAPGVRRGCP